MHFDQIDANAPAKEKFLFIIGEVCREKNASFHSAFSVKEIFAKKEDLPREPSQIPGSPHWAKKISQHHKKPQLFSGCVICSLIPSIRSWRLCG